VKKDSGGVADALEGWAKLYGLEPPASDLFGGERSDCGHTVFTQNPTGDGALLHVQGNSGLVLGSEVLHEPFEDVHRTTSNRNAFILEERNACLQAYRRPCENKQMEFKHRVKAARKYAGLKQGELAAKVGIKQATISDIETGKSGSSSYTASIAHACGVDPLWLETGQGDMRPKESSTPTDTGENVEPLQVHEASIVALGDIQRVPLISWVAAGTWSEAIDLYEVGDAEVWMPCPDPIGPRGFALRVEGDSMTSPYPGAESYPHGTFIYVDPDVAHKSGDPVIAKLPSSNSATFKIFFEDAGQQYLKPLNPQHPMIPITEETHIVAVLVGSYRKR
jgi:SOS-response transcriptional repressor LexA